MLKGGLMARTTSILRRPLILLPLVIVLVASFIAATAWDASGTHRRIRRKASTASLEAGVQTFVAPDRFACIWFELQPIHLYLCAGLESNEGAFKLNATNLVPSGDEPPNPEDVSDVTIPYVFRCDWTGPQVDPTQPRNALNNYACRYRHLHSVGGRAALVTHTFLLSEIVLVEIGEVEENLPFVWVPPHPPTASSRAA
jgi:hypothetical protein